ncbi:hypothetical protein EDC01DRAFT_635000 [Geopyxis carbonaria]|nr:hypothetical protein EDC01DRAFT_635000 [Geopyxis carbonaria]
MAMLPATLLLRQRLQAHRLLVQTTALDLAAILAHPLTPLQLEHELRWLVRAHRDSIEHAGELATDDDVRTHARMWGLSEDEEAELQEEVEMGWAEERRVLMELLEALERASSVNARVVVRTLDANRVDWGR